VKGEEIEDPVVRAIAEAEEVTDLRRSKAQKPRLLVEPANPDRTIPALRDILADAGGLYDRAGPVQLVFDQLEGGMIAQSLSPDLLILKAHLVCRPYAKKQQRDGSIIEVEVCLPSKFARMYLEWQEGRSLPLLNGIASAPLLREEGTIQCSDGYDPETCLWQERVPDISGLVPEQPTRQDAEIALQVIRDTFNTFCFADAETIVEGNGNLVVNTKRPPGKDESAFLAACLTAVCRPSLHLAPGVLLRAAPMSGAGAGKGLLARCISEIAFGREPHAVTCGSNAEELEKRIAAELIGGGPVLFLDNLNNTALKSDLLASAITERPARVRVLGRSQMMTLNASAFVILTGNGLTVSEDLARRFITIEFDPWTENPESRSFAVDIRAEVRRRRAELLAALLTIWRWGRLNKALSQGQPLGSFEQWCRWVRDPLVALGCQDPVLRVGEAKERDGRRQVITDLFQTWWKIHQDRPVTVRDLADAVKSIADPQGRGRQYLVSYLEKLINTRMAGFVLTRQAAPGKWGPATFALKLTSEAEKHRDHRGHRADEEPPSWTDAPYAPDADLLPVANGHAVEVSDAPYDAYGFADPSSATPGNNRTPGWRKRL
jgi:hypothetical protein